MCPLTSPPSIPPAPIPPIAEIYSPPYLNKGARPQISWGPSSINPGQSIGLKYTSADPVTRAILIRTSSSTHSMAYDARALWLTIEANQGGWVKLATPANRAVTPPGL